MQDLVAEMEADVGSVASAVEAVDGKGLKSIAEIARAVRDKEVEVAALEQTLKAEKKALLKLTDEDLPAMLQEIGLNSFELDDGNIRRAKSMTKITAIPSNAKRAISLL